MTKVTVFGSGTKVLLVVFVASGYAHECDWSRRGIIVDIWSVM